MKPVSTVSREKDLLVLAILKAGRYRVTPDGEVLDLNWRRTGRVRPVAIRRSPRGHCLINLATGGSPRQITALLSRVVALAILGDPGLPLGAVHLDGNLRNNHPANLQWMDLFEGMQHASASGRLNIYQGSAHKNAKITEPVARRIKEALSKGMKPTAVLKSLGLIGKVSRTTVRHIAAGRSWQHL